MANAIGNLCQSFLLSYGVRVGIGILLRAFNLARGHSYTSLLDLKQLVSEKDLIVREEACRIGFLFGGFTGSYHALGCLLTIESVVLYFACMGGIMYHLEHEPDTMAPSLRGLRRCFLASRISNTGPSSNRTASYTYLQTLDAMKKPKLQENQKVETSTSKQYNLESISGL